jgi:hypothetical protein
VTARRQRAPAVAARILAVRVAAVLTLAVLAGCGSTAASQVSRAVPAAAPSLATSAAYADGTWAVVVMGGSRAEHNNFWQVFVRQAKSAAWKLATPLGAASNGGFAVAGLGGPSLVAATRPSQLLGFSPLAASRDNGATWSQDGLLGAPLAEFPDALAGAPDGGLIALTRSGDIEVSAHAGVGWTRLASERSVAASTAGRACGLTRLTSAAYTPSGAPLIAGTCARPGRTGIFAAEAGSWRLAGPALPPGLAGRDVEVLALARTGTTDTALLLAGSGRTTSLLTAWSGSGGRWSLSPPLRLSGPDVRSAAFSGSGAVGVLLAGGRGVSVTGPGAAWRSLPALPDGAGALPAGAVTLAAEPTSGFQALTARRGTLSVWTLAPAGSGWSQAQVIKVAIPYGSSG